MIDYRYHIVQRLNPITNTDAFYVLVVDYHGNIQDTGRHFSTERKALDYVLANPLEAGKQPESEPIEYVYKYPLEH